MVGKIIFVVVVAFIVYEGVKSITKKGIKGKGGSGSGGSDDVKDNEDGTPLGDNPRKPD